MKAHRSLLIKPISLLLWAWFALLLISSATAAAPLVVELEVDDVISPATADFINRGLRQAQKQNAELAIIKLDTPGGLDSSMRKIIRDILASSVPVATYVGPSGARAASAGTFILYASHIAAMTPASNLGAATPVQIGPGGSPEQPQETDDN
ncbi:MAG TPA: nodulation protein NfeD, partial [Burkholderiaceae bacterium]|nr:nodulation protein NfeD [Burkholderiaceae bacterium]